ncbi:MAG: TonB-dependent receptor [Gemmatimonadetes bacterium]|nr:TonB-dependent receptor [Gemmatimonadota bacterium]
MSLFEGRRRPPAPPAKLALAGTGRVRGAVLALLALGSLAPPVFAGTLRGQVTDRATGEPLPLARVTFESEGTLEETRANADGHWRTELDPGRWIVRIAFLEHTSSVDTVSVAAEGEQVLDRALVPESKMETLEVTADPWQGVDDQPSAVRLDARALRSLPAFGEVDPIRTLQYLPGVQAISDISSGLYIRGGGPDQNLILLDGVPIYNPTHAFGLFSTFNADVVRDVTLYKGAYPAAYSGRLGAVLDVTTAPGADDGVHGTVGLSTITGRLSVGGPTGRGHWHVAGRRTYLDPLLDQLRKSTPEIPAYYFYDLNGKFDSRIGEYGLLEWNGYLGRDDLHVDLDADSFVDQRWGNRATSLRYRHDFGDATLALTGSISRYDGDTSVQIFTTPISFGNDLEDRSLGLDWNRDMGNRVLRMGAQTSFYRFRLDQDFNGESQGTVNETPWDASVFFEDDWRFGERANLRFGLRVRRFSEGERILWEPRASGVWPLSETTRLRAATGLYHQYLQLVSTEGFSGGDFYLPIDETTKPGRSWQNVLGVEWEPNREWRFTVEGYGSVLRDLVRFDDKQTAGDTDTSTDSIFLTGGSGWAAGAELFAERRFGNVTGWIGYTLGWTRREFAEVNGGEPYPPKYDRRHDFSAVATWKRGVWTFSDTWTYGTGQAFTPATARYSIRDPATGGVSEFGYVLPGEKNSARLLPYHRMDVAAIRDFTAFGRPAKFMIQVFNLYSRRNEWFVQYDTSAPDAGAEVVQQLPVIPSLGVEFEF